MQEDIAVAVMVSVPQLLFRRCGSKPKSLYMMS
jgi:hypothetical protein